MEKRILDVRMTNASVDAFYSTYEKYGRRLYLYL